MKTKDIQELFDLQNVLAQAIGDVDHDAITSPKVLAALLDWKHQDDGKVDVAPAPPARASKAEPKAAPKTTARRAKLGATTPDPSDPSDDDDEPDF